MDLVELAQHLARGPEYPIGIPRDVCDLFDKLACGVASRGWQRYSSDAIVHRIRWEMHIERGDRAFKLNNNWTAPLARWWLARHPEYPKFFELRERIHDGYAESAA